jgi:hypothetical protein
VGGRKGELGEARQKRENGNIYIYFSSFYKNTFSHDAPPPSTVQNVRLFFFFTKTDLILKKTAAAKDFFLYRIREYFHRPSFVCNPISLLFLLFFPAVKSIAPAAPPPPAFQRLIFHPFFGVMFG